MASLVKGFAKPTKRMGCRAFQCRGARIAHAVNSMAHAHDATARRQFLLEPRAGTFGLADGIQHIEDGTRRTAVKRSLQRPDRRNDRADQIGSS
jgi:hypothetical protein